MICDVDIGNSFIKWRFVGSQQILVSSDPADLVASCKRFDVDRVRVSSVAPLIRYGDIAEHLRDICIPELAVVKPGVGGVELAYQDPLSIGVDRWLSMLAARSINRCDLVVVSAGTAMTVDFVSADGKHLGGLIVPGVHTCAEALYGATDGVGAREVNMHGRWQLGTSTLDCVENGLSAMFQGFVDQVQWQASERLSDSKIMITGGGGSTVLPFFGSNFDVEYYPALVLDGLAVALP